MKRKTRLRLVIVGIDSIRAAACFVRTSTKNRSRATLHSLIKYRLKEEAPLFFSRASSFWLFSMHPYFFPSYNPIAKEYIENVPVMKGEKILYFLSLGNVCCWPLQKIRAAARKEEDERWVQVKRLKRVTEWWCVINTSKEHRFSPSSTHLFQSLFFFFFALGNKWSGSYATVLAEGRQGNKVGTSRSFFSLNLLAKLIIDGSDGPTVSLVFAIYFLT